MLVSGLWSLNPKDFIVKIKKIPRYGDSLKEKLYLPAIFSGMKVTLSHFLTNLKDTDNLRVVWYPEEKPKDITNR